MTQSKVVHFFIRGVRFSVVTNPSREVASLGKGTRAIEV